MERAVTALDDARVALFRAAECNSSMLRMDFLYRARDALNAAGFPRWADLAEAAAGRIGGDGCDMRRLRFDVDYECRRRDPDQWKTRDPDAEFLGPDPNETDDEDREGCTCPHKLGAGGVRMIDKWCPVHGLDPDAEYGAHAGRSAMTRSERWTPGPWRTHVGPVTGTTYIVYGSVGHVVSSIPAACTNGEANARLIAAAPELYDALIAVSDMLFARPDIVKVIAPLMGPAETAVCDAAAAAFAKALGETP
jgi:hypothetical protein